MLAWMDVKRARRCRRPGIFGRRSESPEGLTGVEVVFSFALAIRIRDSTRDPKAEASYALQVIPLPIAIRNLSSKSSQAIGLIGYTKGLLREMQNPATHVVWFCDKVGNSVAALQAAGSRL